MKLLKADNAMVAIKDLNNFRLMGARCSEDFTDNPSTKCRVKLPGSPCIKHIGKEYMLKWSFLREIPRGAASVEQKVY